MATGAYGSTLINTQTTWQAAAAAFYEGTEEKKKALSLMQQRSKTQHISQKTRLVRKEHFKKQSLL